VDTDWTNADPQRAVEAEASLGDWVIDFIADSSPDTL
jgi:hypothetical protein